MEVVSRVGVVDEVPELLAVADAAAGVGVQHDVAGGGHELLLRVEDVAVVREGAAVHLQDQRVLARRVEAGGLDDPAVHRAAVLGRCPAQLLHRAECPLAEEVRVQVGQHALGPAEVRDGDIAGHGRAGHRVGQAALVAGRPEGVVVDVAHLGSANVGHGDAAAAVQGEQHEPRIALVEHDAVDTAAVRRPLRSAPAAARGILHMPVIAPGQVPNVGAVAVRHVQVVLLVPLVPFVVTHVGDKAPVRRYGSGHVGSLAVDEPMGRTVSQRDLVDIRIAHVVDLGAFREVGRHDQGLALGRPGEAPRAELALAPRHLPGRPAVGGDDEEVHVAWRHVPDLVEAERQHVGVLRRRRPLGALRRRRHLADDQRGLRDEARERDAASVRRPCEVARRHGMTGDRGGIARVHPAYVQLRAAAFVRPVRQAAAVRRPAGGVRRVLARVQRPVVRSVRIDHPEVLVAAVGHHVVEVTHVDHLLTVRRNLRVGRVLQFEDVHHLERLRRMRRHGEDRKDKGCSDHRVALLARRFNPGS